jgi:PAS domain S-box-containing protein
MNDYFTPRGDPSVLDPATTESLGKLLANSGHFFWELDRNRRVLFANDRIKAVFGDPLGRPCYSVLNPSDNDCPDCAVQKILEGSDHAVMEGKVHDLKGNSIWLQHVATPIKNDKGEVVGARELLIDVTQHKVREEWLADSERLYRNLVEEVPDIIFSLDQNGKFAFVNTQVEKLLGYPVQEILEKPLKDYVAPDDKERIEDIFKLEHEAIWDEDLTILDSQKVKKFVRIRCKASFDKTNQVLEFDGVMRDRTFRKSLEEELKSSKSALIEKIKIIDDLYEHIVQSGKCKAIEEHTAEVAHELRQPLAIVGGFARRLGRQLDSEDQPDPERQKQYVGIIITEIQRLEKILDRLIDFTKRTSISRKIIDPNELIEYILGITEGRMKEKQLLVDMNLGLEIGDIPVDPGRFQQLVLNLVSNAIEASPVGGVIELTTGVSIPSDKALKTGQFGCSGFFEIKMSNNGPAIPPEAIQNVFNPFFTTKQQGTGLGLTVCKKIVEDHFGSISVKSDENGTVFTIWLPLTEIDALSNGSCFLPSILSARS